MMGMRVSKTGYDADSTNNINLSFSSDLATHSIFNVVTVTISSGNSSGVFYHNLGYIPKTWIFIEENDGEDYIKRIPLDRFADAASIDYYVTTSQVVIEVEDTTTNYSFKLIIFTRSPTP